jgi:flavin-dependent dehydrogenase
LADLDLIIVGAGPAGLAAAIGARKAGLSCLVIEKRKRPLDKACGEGVMPAGVAALGNLGIDPANVPHRSFQGVRYVTEDRVAEGRFVSYGIGVRRTELIDALAIRAQDLGALLWFGVPVDSWEQTSTGVRVHTTAGAVTGAFLAAADGLHSTIRKKSGLERPRRGRTRFGVRRHYNIAPWSHFVEVHWTRDVEAYVTPIRENEVGVAILYPGDGRKFDELLEECGELHERLTGHEQVGRDRGAGPLRVESRRVTDGRIALIGDAAGYVDAITGEGVTLALESARGLVEVLSASRPISDYERFYWRMSRTYRWFTHALLGVASVAPLRKRLLASLARTPETFDRFLQMAAGERTYREIGIGDVARLAVGMVRP